MEDCITIPPDVIFISAYEKLRLPVFNYAYRLLGDKEEASDIAAEALINVWRSRRSFSSVGDIKIFACVCAKNACYNRLKQIKRRKYKQKELLQQANEHTAADLFELSSETIEVSLISAVTSLDAKYQKSIWLFYYRQMNCSAIASMLHLSEPQVRYRLRKGKELIKAALHP